MRNQLKKLLILVILLTANHFVVTEVKAVSTPQSKGSLTDQESTLAEILDNKLMTYDKTRKTRRFKDSGLQFYYNSDLKGRSDIISGKSSGLDKRLKAQREILEGFKGTSYGPRKDGELYGFRMSVPLDRK